MNIDKLKEAIASKDVKVISFDIFDTLLSRPCLLPYHLFRAAGRRCGFDGDFETVRRQAEHTARVSCPEGDEDVTFDDIYRELALLIGEQSANRLKQAEMQAEYDYLYPRKPIEEVFHYALARGKQVIIVSDMYLPSVFFGARPSQKRLYRVSEAVCFQRVYAHQAHRESLREDH